MYHALSVYRYVNLQHRGILRSWRESLGWRKKWNTLDLIWYVPRRRSCRQKHLAGGWINQLSFRRGVNTESDTRVPGWKLLSIYLAILCDLLGMAKWPFQRLSDLQLRDKEVALNHLVVSKFTGPFKRGMKYNPLAIVITMDIPRKKTTAKFHGHHLKRNHL